MEDTNTLDLAALAAEVNSKLSGMTPEQLAAEYLKLRTQQKTAALKAKKNPEAAKKAAKRRQLIMQAGKEALAKLGKLAEVEAAATEAAKAKVAGEVAETVTVEEIEELELEEVDNAA